MILTSYTVIIQWPVWPLTYTQVWCQSAAWMWAPVRSSDFTVSLLSKTWWSRFRCSYHEKRSELNIPLLFFFCCPLTCWQINKCLQCVDVYLHFQSGIFHEDLYPLTARNQAAMTAQEWLLGINRGHQMSKHTRSLRLVPNNQLFSHISFRPPADVSETWDHSSQPLPRIPSWDRAYEAAWLLEDPDEFSCWCSDYRRHHGGGTMFSTNWSSNRDTWFNKPADLCLELLWRATRLPRRQIPSRAKWSDDVATRRDPDPSVDVPLHAALPGARWQTATDHQEQGEAPLQRKHKNVSKHFASISFFLIPAPARILQAARRDTRPTTGTESQRREYSKRKLANIQSKFKCEGSSATQVRINQLEKEIRNTRSNTRATSWFNQSALILQPIKSSDSLISKSKNMLDTCSTPFRFFIDQESLYLTNKQTPAETCGKFSLAPSSFTPRLHILYLWTVTEL